MDLNLDELTGAARLSGRIDTLIELRKWLEEKIKAADEENEKRRKGIYEHDVRTTSDAAH